MNHPYKKNPTHKGIENIKLKVKWLEGVKTFGIRPIILE